MYSPGFSKEQGARSTLCSVNANAPVACRTIAHYPMLVLAFDLSILTPRRVTYPTFSRVAWPILRDQLSLYHYSSSTPISQTHRDNGEIIIVVVLILVTKCLSLQSPKRWRTRTSSLHLAEEPTCLKRLCTIHLSLICLPMLAVNPGQASCIVTFHLRILRARRRFTCLSGSAIGI